MTLHDDCLADFLDHTPIAVIAHNRLLAIKDVEDQLRMELNLRESDAQAVRIYTTDLESQVDELNQELDDARALIEVLRRDLADAATVRKDLIVDLVFTEDR